MTLREIVRLPLRLIAGEKPRKVLTGGLRGAAWLPNASTHGCWLGTYERQVQSVLSRLLEPGQVFFDIGANVGYHSLLGSRLVGPSGRVVAFEPFERNLAYLRRHLDLNNADNVTVMAVAVAESSGRGYVRVDANPSMVELSDRGAQVALVSLDELIRAQAAPVPRVLKIDVEGAESRVLRGAADLLRAHRPAIVLAAHGWRQYVECRAVLEDQGYEITTLRDGRIDGNYSLLAA